MKRIFAAVLVLASTGLAVSPRAQRGAPLQLAVIYAQVDQLFNDYMAVRHVPGAGAVKYRASAAAPNCGRERR